MENNWCPIFLGAGNGTGTMSFCGTFFVINTGDYWIMICVPIFVKGRERYFETDIYLITSSLARIDNTGYDGFCSLLYCSNRKRLNRKKKIKNLYRRETSQ